MVEINIEKCIGCGLCAKDCVAESIAIQNGKAVFLAKGCICCGHCYAVCPQEAVIVSEMMPDDGNYTEMTEFDSGKLLLAMKSRRSVRQFSSRAVEQEKINRIIEAGRYSPTGSNSQDIAFTILGSRQAVIEHECVSLFRKGISVAGKIIEFAKDRVIDDHFFFKGAPLVIVISSRSKVDAGLASSYMELMAESMGLGVLYSGFFIACTAFSGKVKKLLSLPQGHKAVTCMVIGYPSVKYRRIPSRNPANVNIL